MHPESDRRGRSAFGRLHQPLSGERSGDSPEFSGDQQVGFNSVSGRFQPETDGLQIARAARLRNAPPFVRTYATLFGVNAGGCGRG
jgi:hypothetical protein